MNLAMAASRQGWGAEIRLACTSQKPMTWSYDLMICNLVNFCLFYIAEMPKIRSLALKILSLDFFIADLDLCTLASFRTTGFKIKTLDKTHSRAGLAPANLCQNTNGPTQSALADHSDPFVLMPCVGTGGF